MRDLRYLDSHCHLLGQLPSHPSVLNLLKRKENLEVGHHLHIKLLSLMRQLQATLRNERSKVSLFYFVKYYLLDAHPQDSFTERSSKKRKLNSEESKELVKPTIQKAGGSSVLASLSANTLKHLKNLKKPVA